MSTPTLSHLAGPDVVVEGRVIQRCLICGAKLADSDGVMQPIKPGEEPQFPVWPAGQFVRVATGNPTHYSLVAAAETELPDDACTAFI